MSGVPRILIVGANGQIGTELAVALAQQHDDANVITSDISPQGRVPALRHEMLDCTDAGTGGRACPAAGHSGNGPGT